MKKFMVKMLKFYQAYISPFLPGACRFYPSCSNYVHQCFNQYTIGRAFFLSVKRLMKCHPYHPGGFDPLA